MEFADSSPRLAQEKSKNALTAPAPTTPKRLEKAIKLAEIDPWRTDCIILESSLERILEDLPQAERMTYAARIFLAITDILLRKAKLFTDQILQKDHSGPILTPEMLSPFLRRTMDLNLDQLIEASPIFSRSPHTKKLNQFTEIDKEELLNWVEAQNTSVEEIVEQMTYEEDHSIWLERIKKLIDKNHGSIELSAIVSELRVSVGSVWMVLLLGGFQLRKKKSIEDFYSSEITISCLE
ncbi:hypothetical protein [Acaryochloris sp. CCMEE 5410]|uniref:hypothetical protein n=1 Tax=Acaryochloris sp. CCMEE 5410 TaxID=310037 RepID=UPI0011119ED8|nr:hypothetical protein [Acaryochloris sp. CCMEE 5410]KAI9130187.1 hypothetical protein ON05_031680 [Acaryochloris sp. CCMEE 5410]